MKRCICVHVLKREKRALFPSQALFMKSKMAVSSPGRHITEIIENDAIITSHVFDDSGYMAWAEVGRALAHQGSR